MSRGSLWAAGLLALALGPLPALLAPAPELEVRKPPRSLHAGELPSLGADPACFPGQAFRLASGSPRAIEVGLAALTQRAAGPGDALVLLVSSAPDPSGPFAEVERVRLPLEGLPAPSLEQPWLRFELAGTHLGPSFRIHLAREGEAALAPWLRPRGAAVSWGGWGDQQAPVTHLRGRLPGPSAGLTALAFPAAQLAATPPGAEPARLRLADVSGPATRILGEATLDPRLELGPTWLWFSIAPLADTAADAPLVFELQLPEGSVLVGSGGTPRPTTFAGVEPLPLPDRPGQPAPGYPSAGLGFLRGADLFTDRDLLVRVWSSAPTGLAARLGERGGSRAWLGLGLAFAAGVLVLGALVRVVVPSSAS